MAAVRGGKRLLTAAALVLLCKTALTDNPEEQLKSTLLANYKRANRPFVASSYAPVMTQVGVMLRSFQMDEFHLTSAINAWVIMVWSDPRLSWVPEEHSGLQMAHFYSSQIWLPDIMLINGVTHTDATFLHVPVAVLSAGTVIWVTPSTFRVRCLKEMSSWPYDRQNCTAILSSWSLDRDQHEILPATHDGRLVLSEDMVKTDSHWQTVSAIGRLANVTYNCCPGSVWHEVVVELHVARVSMLYALSFILPCVALAAHVLGVFWIAPESSAKLIVCAVHSATLIFFLINLFWFMPPVGGHSVPRVVSFVAGSLAMSVLASLTAVVTTNLASRQSETAPAPLLAVFSGVAGSVLRLGDLQLQVQGSRAPFAEDGVPAQDKEAQKTIRRAEWKLVAAGVDRVVCLAQLILFVLLALSCLT